MYMSQEEHKVIYEKKIVVDSRTKPLSGAPFSGKGAMRQEQITEEVQGDRPRLLFVITQGMWEEPQKYVIQLARYFAPRYQLHLVFGTFEFTGRNVFREEFEALGGVVHTVDALTHKPVLGNDLVCVFKLRTILAQIKPEVVHVHDAKTAFIVGLARLMSSGSRQVATVHGFRDTTDNKSYEVAIFEFFIKLGFNFASRLICRDQYTYTKAQELFGTSKTQLILPGISEVHFLNPEEKLRAMVQDAPDSIAAALQQAGTMIVGGIAPLEADQGIAYTLQALKILQEEGLSFVYIHYGDGDQKHLLEHEVVQFGLSDRVIFKGLDKMAHLYLQIFDVVVHPTLRPGDTTLLRDCGLARRAVVISDVEGVGETVESGVHALVVTPRDNVALAKAIESLAHNKDRRDALGEALEQRIRAYYSEEEMFRQTELVYEGS